MRNLSVLLTTAAFICVLQGCQDDESTAEPAAQNETESTASEGDPVTESEMGDTSVEESVETTQSNLVEMTFGCESTCFVGTKCKSSCEKVVAMMDPNAIDWDAIDAECEAIYETLCESPPIEIEKDENGKVINEWPPGKSDGIEFSSRAFEWDPEQWGEENPCFYSAEQNDPCICGTTSDNAWDSCNNVDDKNPIPWLEVCVDNQKTIEECGESGKVCGFDGTEEVCDENGCAFVDLAACVEPTTED